MALAQTFLHTLLAAATASAAPTTRLEIDAGSILASVAPPEIQQAFAVLFDRAVGEGLALEELQPQIESLAAGLRGAPKQLSQLIDQLQTIIALAHPGGLDGTLAEVGLDLAASPLTNLVTIWHLEGTAAESPASVVCMGGLSSAERVVYPRGGAFIERRLSLRLTPADRYPLIEVDVPTALPSEAAPRVRTPWRQLPLPDYDLTIYTEQERLKGSVRTRRLAAPVSLQRPSLRIELPAAPGAQLLATELLDEEGRMLLQVLRWPPLGPEPAG